MAATASVSYRGVGVAVWLRNMAGFVVDAQYYGYFVGVDRNEIPVADQ